MVSYNNNNYYYFNNNFLLIIIFIIIITKWRPIFMHLKLKAKLKLCEIKKKQCFTYQATVLSKGTLLTEEAYEK